MNFNKQFVTGQTNDNLIEYLPVVRDIHVYTQRLCKWPVVNYKHHCNFEVAVNVLVAFSDFELWAINSLIIFSDYLIFVLDSIMLVIDCAL